MLIVLYIFIGLLLFDCFVASCIYFQKDRLYKQQEFKYYTQCYTLNKEQLDHFFRLLARDARHATA